MAMAERRNLLVDFVNSEGSVTFAQIKQQFPDVSDMTLRTDLKALDQQGEIIRVHGGAKSVGFAVGTDDLLSRRAGRRSAEKALIAKKAASLITPGHTIFIDSGSTTTALAAAMEDMDLLVFTSSLTVASELARLEHVMTLSSTTPIPVSSTAIFANGIRAWLAAIAAALKILSTCSWV